jgi:hypothetical protein
MRQKGQYRNDRALGGRMIENAIETERRMSATAVTLANSL